MQRLSPRILVHIASILLALLAVPGWAQETPDMAGRWVFNEKLSDDTDDQVEKTLKAMGRIDELATVVTFLAGPGGGFINGQVIPVTGGLDWTY
jgi:NAD(P)-dependent dehydrogenase (short-subunit alcohol dehydrogenase family)